jgi:hypothetical protein
MSKEELLTDMKNLLYHRTDDIERLHEASPHQGRLKSDALSVPGG